jgi:hypothetical protein
MKRALTLSAILLITACGDKPADAETAAKATTPNQTQTAKPKATASQNSGTDLSRETDKWLDQTKKLGSSAWDATKDAAGDAYGAAKKESSKAYDSVKSGEFMRKMRESAKMDKSMGGHPPAAD